MKKLISKSLLALLVGIGLTSCGGGGAAKLDPNMSDRDRKVVEKTEKSLSRGDVIENVSVVTCKLPLALLEPEYKGTRDQVNKARLDYVNCLKRGLEQPAQKQLQILSEIQKGIVEKNANLSGTSPDYIFVLADVKERSRRDGNLSGYIAVYDASNLEEVDLIQVTKPLYNNAVMVTEALQGSLDNPDTFSQDSANVKSDNPVVNFILQSHPK